MRLQKILAESYLNRTSHFRDEVSLGITLGSPMISDQLESALGQFFAFRLFTERQFSSAEADQDLWSDECQERSSTTTTPRHG
jgi:hypothetical protein